MSARVVAWLVVTTVAACNRSTTVRSEPNDVAAPLAAYPLNRLHVEGNPVEPLDLPIADADLRARGVRSYRAFTATAPRVWLLVFELESSEGVQAAAADPRKLMPSEPPFYVKTSTTGRWILLTGFPGSKPVSPEMEAARTLFLSRWAGDE
jgi:hypothetical protein